MKVWSLSKEFMRIARTIKARRPYDDDKPLGYLESDDDYYDNNQAAAIELLDLAVKVAKNARVKAGKVSKV